jgi:hypothetical protein
MDARDKTYLANKLEEVYDLLEEIIDFVDNLETDEDDDED